MRFPSSVIIVLWTSTNAICFSSANRRYRVLGGTETDRMSSVAERGDR